MEVFANGDGNLGIRLPDGHYLHELARGLSKRRWLPVKKVWVFPPVISIMDTVKKYFGGVVWTPEAEAIYLRETGKEAHRADQRSGKIEIDLSVFDNTPFKRKPRDSQKRALYLSKGLDEFAYLMDQGTGKTKVILDDAAANYRAGKIDCLIILCPNSVKTNWVNPDEDLADEDTWDEVTRDMAPDIPYVKGTWFATPRGKARDAFKDFEKALESKTNKLLIFSCNIDGIHAPRAEAFLTRIVKLRNVYIAVDESTRIANHTSVRHKTAYKLRLKSKVARIASGTPVIKSPLKAYGQFRFLNPNIMGISTYAEFKARYSVTNPNNANHIVKFINTDEIAEKIAGCSYRVLKSECLDLEPKVHQKRTIYMNPSQERHYAEMREEFITYLEKTAELRNGKPYISASNVMVQMARLQQITAGYLPILDEFGTVQIGVQRIGNSVPPKISEAVDIVNECDHKVIIWCKYLFEVKEMSEALAREGVTHVTFYGKTSDSDRTKARQRFISDPELKVFVGQIATGGIGLNLYTANTVIYLSNTFDTEQRLQSEDRAHRAGLVGGVLYIDLITPKTVDEKVMRVLRGNKMLADEIMRDGYRAWL